MTIAIVSTSNTGGAGKAALRLHQGLQRAGRESRMLVSWEASSYFNVFASYTWRSRLTRLLGPRSERFASSFYRGNNARFSSAWFPSETASRICLEKTDVVNLHWVNDGYLSVRSISKIQGPIIWTLHDMWPFTGGCHYAGGCNGFELKCGNCPQLGSHRAIDLSRLNMVRKKRSWRKTPMTIITPSRWLGETARQSSLFHDWRVEVIPNGIDLTRFKPVDQSWARSILGLDNGKTWLLFGAWGGTDDPRKGFDLLHDALGVISQDSRWKNRIGLMVFGSNNPDGKLLPFPVKNLGELNDDVSLSVAYNAADAFVAPSREDNLPNTIVEALSCGVPSAAFKIGGMSDLIDHRKNGYLAEAYSAHDLAEGIKWLISSNDRLAMLKQNARQKAENEFGIDRQASRYISLFEEVLQ